MSQPKAFPVEPSWQALLVDLGVNPIDVLKRAQLPLDLFNQPSMRLSTKDYFAFWEAIEAEVGDPLLPLKLGQVAAPDTFSPPLFAALCSPNFSVAVARLSIYKRLIAPVRLTYEEDHRRFTLSIEWLDSTLMPPQSLVATELVFFMTLIRLCTRRKVLALRAVMPNPPEEQRAYRDYFGVKVTSGAALSLTIPSEDAHRPFLTANEQMWQIFEPELRRRLSDLDAEAPTHQRVRAVLLEALPSGQGTMETVARRLAMSKRTLQRRLKQEDTSFQVILRETREALAMHYLGHTTLTCAEISFLIGFEDPNSFFRAFHLWTGDTPEHLRQQLLA